jgi:hypothetical protein
MEILTELGVGQRVDRMTGNDEAADFVVVTETCGTVERGFALDIKWNVDAAEIGEVHREREIVRVAAPQCGVARLAVCAGQRRLS